MFFSDGKNNSLILRVLIQKREGGKQLTSLQGGLGNSSSTWMGGSGVRCNNATSNCTGSATKEVFALGHINVTSVVHKIPPVRQNLSRVGGDQLWHQDASRTLGQDPVSSEVLTVVPRRTAEDATNNNQNNSITIRSNQETVIDNWAKVNVLLFSFSFVCKSKNTL